jgi:hypothetical protein
VSGPARIKPQITTTTNPEAAGPEQTQPAGREILLKVLSDKQEDVIKTKFMIIKTNKN